MPMRTRIIRLAFYALALAGLILLFTTASAKGDGGAPFGPPPPHWYLAKQVFLRGAATTTFTVRVVRPRKIVLYPATTNVRTSVVCLKGSTVSHLSRVIVGETTRDLLWHVPGRRFDQCYVTVAAAQSGGRGFVSVQAMVRQS